MKARLIYTANSYQLLLYNGSIKKFSPEEALHFIKTFDSELHYAAPGKWNIPGFSMDDYGGETIARVNDDGSLVVVSGKHFRRLLVENEFKYLTVDEYAEKHGKKRAIVSRLCNESRIPGIKKAGSRWLIPEDAPYPEDSRVGRRM